MIELSVCIPMFRSKYIGWLAMESLCRQEGIDFEWELIIAEEVYDEAFGKLEIDKYALRLENVGCVRIKYLPLTEWIPLSNKYVIMAKKCSASSYIYASFGADIYSQPHRLKEQYDSFMNDKDLDFYVTAKTIFYDILSEKIFLYDVELKKERIQKADGSDRSFRLEIVKNMPIVDKRSGIDGWTWIAANEYVTSKKKKFKHYLDNSTDSWKYGINVHGLNNISHGRKKLFNTYNQKIGVIECPIDITKTIPSDILDKLKKCKKFITLHKK